MKRKTHGGKRANAGRKKLPDHLKKEPTKPVRIPLSKLDLVKSIIK